MEKTKISAEVIAILAKQLGKPVADVTENKRIKEDLGADSLDIVEMLMNLEEKYGITIPDETLADVKTVGDMVRVLGEVVK